MNDVNDPIVHAMQYVRDHFSDDIRLQDVADHVSLSQSRLYRLFKERTGTGFKPYLISLRVREAQRLLVGSELPVTEIFLRCGFPNHASFYRSFQLLAAMKPGEYRSAATAAAVKTYGRSPDRAASQVNRT